ncbi:MAG: hypothetical protein K8S27_00875 [Candidatus Omnitrophica bacterium]|nr:hypothetical protein [Candidatus Omnitrophota bacterium]
MAHESQHIVDYLRGKASRTEKVNEQKATAVENENRASRDLKQREYYGEKKKWKVKQYDFSTCPEQ